MPFARLRAYLEARATFTEEEFAFMRPLFLPKTLRAGEFVQRGGDVPRHSAFVTKGCLRSYVIDAKGDEHIVQFAPEDWWLSDTPAIIAKTPTQYFYQAIEDAEVLLIEPQSQHAIVERVPGYAAAYRTGLQRHAAAKDRRIVSALTMSAEERYLAFRQTYPSIADRVPQWMLASYLGVSPETLSRVRRGFQRK